jgi:Ca-activated chloride channel family protein
MSRAHFLALAAFACTPSSQLFAAPTPQLAPSADITFDVDVGEPMMIAGQEQTAYVKITLGGFALQQAAQRAPVNLSLVIDRSGSMSSDDKLEKAKAAALMVLDRLGPDDIISVVTFDSTVDIVVPATPANEREFIRDRIVELTPRGSTALFAGVSHGIEEIAKYNDHKRINRIILVSDGQANVGPHSPNELGRLGEVAAHDGVSITTIGLGLDYNEDLMTQLAMSSDGNHAFAENSADIETMFSHELGDLLSVVAKDVEVEVSFADGITPVRALGREATITGHTARVSLSQLYAKQQKFVLFEVKVPPGTAGKKRDVADVAVKYANMVSKKQATKKGSVAVAFTTARTEVAQRENKKVMEAAVEAIGAEENRRAVALRDAGKVKDAEKALVDNAKYLQDNATRLESKKLADYSAKNKQAATKVDKPMEWNKARKTMRKEQSAIDMQQDW